MRTIKARLTLWYVLLLFLTLCGFATATYQGVSRSVRARFDASMRSDVTSFAQESEIEDDGELDLETEILTHGERLAAYNPSGGVVVRVGLPLREQAVGVPPLGFDTVVEGGVPWRRLTVEAPAIGMVVQVSRSAEEVERSLSYLFWFLLLGVPLTSLAAGAGGLFLASRLLNPLDKITRTAAELSASDLSRRLSPLPTQDELSRLVQTFNQMLARLEDAFLRQKQLTSDAAHELRTPLAVLLARAEVTLSQPRSPEEHRAALQEIAEGLGEMARLVQTLLTLARADAGQLALEREEIDLGDLARDAVESLRTLYPTAQLSVRTEPCPLLGDQTRLTEVVLNLVENALQACPSTGTILVEVRRLSHQAVLSVSDNGPGVAPQERERIFERFVQGDLARTPRKGSGGAGLGLPIARAIARQHGGDLTLRERSLLGGATFDLTLPLPTPPSKEPPSVRSSHITSLVTLTLCVGLCSPAVADPHLTLNQQLDAVVRYAAQPDPPAPPPIDPAPPGEGPRPALDGPPEADPVPAERRFPQWSFESQIQFQVNDGELGSSAATSAIPINNGLGLFPADSRLFVRRFRPSVDIAFTPNFDLQTEFNIDPQTQRTQILDVRFNHDLSDNTFVSVGRYKVPFGWEGLRSSRTTNTIERSDATVVLYPERDVGLSFTHRNPQLGVFSLGTFLGQPRSNGASNGSYDVIGRGHFNLSDQLQIGLSGHLGTFRRSGTEVDLPVRRLGAELQYASGPWKFESEAFLSDGFNTMSGIDSRASGYYLTAMYALTPGLELVLNYDWFDPDLEASSANRGRNQVNSRDRKVIGLNYEIDGDGNVNHRIMFNYEWRSELEGARLRTDGFRARYQLAW